ELGAEVFEGNLTGGFVDEDDVGSGAGGFVARFGPDDDRRMALRHLRRSRGRGRRVLDTGRVLRPRFRAVEPVAVGAATSGRVADGRISVPGIPDAAEDVDDRTGLGPGGDGRGGVEAPEQVRLVRDVRDVDGHPRT